jgi:hypothetical protein
MDNKQAERYIKAIRNSCKRIYAQMYWNALVQGVEPQVPNFGLSNMARQAVRMRLAEFTKREANV